MVRLLLTFNEQVIKEYPFVKDGVTIGRQEDNTIPVDNLAVSGYHARIDRAGSDYILTDLQSTNGTFVNNQKVVSHKLSHGDMILIGKHVIFFMTSEKGSASEAEEIEKKLAMGKTMVLDTAKHRDLMAKQKAAHSTSVPEKIGVVSFIDSSGLGEIALTKKLTKIGKAETSEIRLSGILMGSTAATISHRPTGYTISFQGGRTKLKVNGEVVTESVALKDFDTIELGSYKFQFYERGGKSSKSGKDLG